ncbi:AAA domain protein [Selenomonas sp. FOBRC9]|uniref:AAA family ATPase n=1 Tax=Selenomonas sp. FOBRC9 TaxID=936573 RepID=UPI00027A4EB6|nr:AAA family ATPase [Selenomonas sp. FOBRC9]EJP30152.1 AAA domain protein [Selenomonas sp. FOBRC9]DAJ16597.1 MAG TPA: putative ATPase, putative transposase [Myoviridae sp. ctict13]
MTAEAVNMDAETANVIRRVEDYLAAHKEVSREQFAKMAGISGGALSSFLKGRYAGRVDLVAQKIAAVLDTEESREGAVTAVKEPDIVETAVMQQMMFGLQYANDRNDIICIYGAPGIGKTVTVNKWVDGHPNSIFFTASPNIHNGRDVMEEILEAIGKKQTGRNKALEKSIVQILKGSNRAIIIDEAHFLRLSALETLRRIHDITEVPLILVGNPAIMDIITEQNKTLTGQFFSRAVRIALDAKVPLEDVKKIVLQNGVEMDKDCLTELHRIARGTGALRVMTKLFLFAWMLANDAKRAIGMDDIIRARQVIISPEAC